MKYLHKILAIVLLPFLLGGCRKEEPVDLREEVNVNPPEISSVEGFYLLNEGNMGSNKSTLDYYDYSTGTYERNIFGSANPTVPKELGDVGNDIAIYRSRLYAVINCSNKVEVMDAATATRRGQIDIPNCRYMAFSGDNLYVTSYAGPVQINPNYEQKGYVARIDVNTLKETGRCVVGFQPDGICIAGGKIYVANSGGYMVPNYESTVSVIDEATFAVVGTIDVALNLHYCMADRNGRIWISSRGDYYQIPSRLFCYDPKRGEVVKALDVPVGDMCIDDDRIYIVANGWSNVTMSYTNTFAVVDINSMEKIADSFITDGTGAELERPYGVAVNPVSKDIFVTDARNYVSPGYLYCYDKEGKRKWSVRTGDIPAHFAFRVKCESDDAKH